MKRITDHFMNRIFSLTCLIFTFSLAAFALETKAPKGFDGSILDVVKEGKVAKTDLTPPEDKKTTHVIFRTFVPGRTTKQFIDLVQNTGDYDKFLKPLISDPSNLEPIADKRDSEKVKNENKLSILPEAKFDLTVRVALERLKSFGGRFDVFFDVFRLVSLSTPTSNLMQNWVFVDKKGSNLYKQFTLPIKETTLLTQGKLEDKDGLYVEDDVSITLRKEIDKADLLKELRSGLVDSFENFLLGIRARLLDA